MTTLFDNIDVQLGERLVETLRQSNRIDAAVGYFNLRGWSDLADALDEKIPGDEPAARILVGMTLSDQHDRVIGHLQSMLEGDENEPEIDGSVARSRREIAIHRFRQQLMRGVPSESDRVALQKLRQQLSSGLLRVKLFTRRPMHAKAYICHRDDTFTPIIGYVGSSNLTFAGLKHQYELNVDVLDGDAAKKLADWFVDRWEDRFTVDITSELIEVIDESWASKNSIDPYLVYLKVCYLISQEARDGLVEYSLPSSVQSQLLEFQVSAVKTLARRIVNRGGAMLGDVVGLGKTITSVAVALMLSEDYGYRTLVLCPKNLVDMWEQYLDTYDLRGRVIPYSMATKELKNLKRYQFVIVDESHTLRSNSRQDYLAIHEYIRANESKVLLLTATPYNKRYGDVANQLALFINDDDNLGISPMAAIKKNPKLIDQVDGKVSTLEAFRRSEEPEDWRRLMSEHLVRRTRSFIRQNFSKTDPENGREFLTFSDGSRFYFPKRIAHPLAHSFGPSDPGRQMAEDSTLDVIQSLLLPRYGLTRYIDAGKEGTELEAKTLADLQRASGQLIGFTRTSLYKRLSSCGHSFVVSLRRQLSRNLMYLYALEHGKSIPVGSILEGMVELDTDDDVDDADGTGSTPEAQYEELVRRSPKSIRWLRSELFTPQLASDLRLDSDAISGLLEKFGEWKQEFDSKIDALYEMVATTHIGEKVLIFSEYKDTVEYVAQALRERGVESVEAVSGATSSPTSLAQRFSPNSNNRLFAREELSIEDPIRVLVSTDVLSEGQNLQDAHIVVMYDLPWAIIRLIQRAGRIDRVGQTSEEVLVYSFLPDNNVEEVLGLRSRIRRRLAESASVFGSDEQFFGTDDEVGTIQDLYRGALEDSEDEEVDAASFAYQVWQRAEREFPALAERARSLPDLVFSSKYAQSDLEQKGVLAYVRTDRGFDGFGISPFGEDPRLLTSLEALRMMSCEPDAVAAPKVVDHFERVETLVKENLQRPQLATGQLRGTRLKIWRRLNGNLDAASPEMEKALDTMYASSLTSEAESRLKVALRERSNSDLADLLGLLFRDGKLVVPVEVVGDPLRIVCSMGIVSK